MKKILASVVAVVMAVVLLAGCGGASGGGAKASNYGEGYVFKHGFDQDYPPYSHIDDNGQVSGFDIEMAKAVCDYYKWTYEPVPFNWDAKDAELNAGSCDCIWSGFTMSNSRKDKYTWSKVYSDNTQKILVKKGSSIKSLADLAGKKVGVQTSTSAYDMLTDDSADGKKALADTFADGEAKVYDTYNVAFNDLKAGAIDAIAIDVTAGNHLIKDEADYEYLSEDLGKEEYAIGFRLGDEELRNKVNEAIDALVANGTYDQIGQKYPEIYDYLCLKK